MPELPKVVRVHEATVRKVAAGEHEGTARRRRRRGKGAIVGDLLIVKVDSRVWERAQELAEKPNHIQIIDETTVIVWNHPAPWPQRGGGHAEGT